MVRSSVRRTTPFVLASQPPARPVPARQHIWRGSPYLGNVVWVWVDLWGGTPHALLGGLKFCVPQPRLFSTLPHLRHCQIPLCIPYSLFCSLFVCSARPPAFCSAPLKSFTPPSGDGLFKIPCPSYTRFSALHLTTMCQTPLLAAFLSRSPW